MLGGAACIFNDEAIVLKALMTHSSNTLSLRWSAFRHQLMLLKSNLLIKTCDLTWTLDLTWTYFD